METDGIRTNGHALQFSCHRTRGVDTVTVVVVGVMSADAVLLTDPPREAYLYWN
jgi:hypothetical protein